MNIIILRVNFFGELKFKFFLPIVCAHVLINRFYRFLNNLFCVCIV